MSTTLMSRVTIAAKILGSTPEKILNVLKENGIEDNAVGISILDSSTTTVEDLVGIVLKNINFYIKLISSSSFMNSLVVH